VLSQCCCVTEIREWGKRILGRKATRLEKDNVDVTDYRQIIAPW